MKRFIYTFICTFMMCVFVSAFILYYYDPFYVFHMPFADMKPIQTNDAHYVARGLIRNMDYEILVCGSSMCENMHVDYIDDLYGKKSIKVVQHGSYSKDLEASLRVAANEKKAQVILMALDSSIWNKPSDSYRIEDIPQYAVRKTPFLYSIPYLLNSSNYSKCIELVQANNRGTVTPMNEWWCYDDISYSTEELYSSYRELRQGANKAEYDKNLARENLENIIKGVEACEQSGIEIDFFIPPYSVANFAFSDYRTMIEDYKEIWRQLLEYNNVYIYAVQFDTDLICDFNNYRNTNHYNGKVADTIIDDIYYGKYELKKDNIDSEVGKFIEWLDKYDWGELDKASGVVTD